MASETIDPNLSTQKIEVAHNIQAWFTVETLHQLKVGFKSHKGTLAETRDDLLTRQVGHDWNHFRRVRRGTETYPNDQTRRLEIGRGVLRACVAAQGAYVWHEVERGTSREGSLYNSLMLIDGYVSRIESGKKLPDYDLLEKPVRDAVNEFAGVPNAFYRPVSTFNTLVYLATSAIIEQTNDHDGLILPQPAVIDDDVLIPWRHE